MPLSNKELRADLNNVFPNSQKFLSDKDYLTPQKSWVSGDLYFKNFKKWLWSNNLDTWQEYWDCDNFAFALYTFSQICHARTMEKTKEIDRAQGLALGVIFYKMDGVGGHAINFVHTEDKIYGFEPQSGKYLNLSKKEKESCWLVVC